VWESLIAFSKRSITRRLTQESRWWAHDGHDGSGEKP
jgi:hypothetical protein